VKPAAAKKASMREIENVGGANHDDDDANVINVHD
jgi:hypothetical protein